MKKDIPKLSTGPQTAALEGFHAIVNHFAPKMIGFSYHGMLSRKKTELYKVILKHTYKLFWKSKNIMQHMS
jgi:hypothetical protein